MQIYRVLGPQSQCESMKAISNKSVSVRLNCDQFERSRQQTNGYMLGFSFIFGEHGLYQDDVVIDPWDFDRGFGWQHDQNATYRIDFVPGRRNNIMWAFSSNILAPLLTGTRTLMQLIDNWFIYVKNYS